MVYRVFAQVPSGRLDLSLLVQHARRFFEATVEVLGENGLVEGVSALAEPGSPPWARIRIESARRRFSGTFRVVCRTADASDWEAARRAEQSGRATGMGQLAARCGSVWLVEPEQANSEPALLNLCALLASIALGPVMPTDESTLFGIRGAMERLDLLTGPSLAR